MSILALLYLILDLFSLGFFFVGLFSSNATILLLSLTSLTVSNALYSFKDIQKNILFFCFNGTFFIFLIGRMIVTTFFGYKEDLRGLNGLNFTDNNLIVITLVALYLSLASIRIGYILFKRIKLDFIKRRFIPDNKRKALELSSLILFSIAIVFRLYIVIEMRQATVSEGYFETFSQFRSSLPRVIQTFADMYDMFFFAFLATLPSKKKTLIPTLLYLLEGTIAASSGRRSVLMLNVLIVAIYYVVRNNKEKNDMWFGIKETVGSVIALPMLMGLMTFIGRMRAAHGVQRTGSIFDSIFEFFYSQGVSANLIGYTEMYKEQIPNRFYTLGPIYEFVNESLIKPLKGIQPFFGQTAERAMNGHLLSQTLPYFIDQRAYLAGYGWGSSIVSENYADGGFVGVIIGGLIYGLILLVLAKIISDGSFLIMTFGLAMSRIILFAPRGAYLSFIVSSMSPRKIAAVVLVIMFGWLLNQIMFKEKRVMLKSEG